MDSEQELWAWALAIEREHGERADDFLLQRIQEMFLAGDRAGLFRWLEIAEKLDRLHGRNTTN